MSAGVPADIPIVGAMSETIDRYAVQVDWPTVVPLGDTLAVSTAGAFDDRWVDAFEVVLGEHEHRSAGRKWRRIDFDQGAGDDAGVLDLYVRGIEPDAEAPELRRTVDDLVRGANDVARVGTHVYHLARELREAPAEGPRGSVPPPTFDPLADELDADAA
jgi:hypothetical protein